MTLDTYFFLGTVAEKRWSSTSLRRKVAIMGCSDRHFVICTVTKCRVRIEINVNEVAHIPDENSENMKNFILENIVNSIPNFYRIQ